MRAGRAGGGIGFPVERRPNGGGGLLARRDAANDNGAGGRLGGFGLAGSRLVAAWAPDEEPGPRAWVAVDAVTGWPLAFGRNPAEAIGRAAMEAAE
jgi:hypothetical protein